MLETARLRLREIRETDAPRLLSLYRDPAIARFMGPAPVSLAAELANVQRHRTQYYGARGYGLWAVTLKEDGHLIGRCGLLETSVNERPEVELSYLIDPTLQRQGLGTEAARAVVAFAADTLRLRRLVALIQRANVASRQVAERIGMRQEGTAIYKAFGMVDLFVLRVVEEPSDVIVGASERALAGRLRR
jgi:[ribosomal protein S5]-alanine N-acetyltransferase